MNNILTEFNKSDMLLDKTTQSLTALPFNRESIFIKNNQYVTSDNFNGSLEKLYYNFLFLFRGCNIGNFEMFNTYFYTISTSKNLPFYTTTTKPSYETTLVNNYSLSATFTSALVPSSDTNLNNYLFFADKSSITCILLKETSVDYIFKTNNVDPLSGDISFVSISDLKTDYFENLYVVDSVYNNIYQYNIKNFISKENIFKEKLFLKNVIGGQGTSNDKTKFNGLKNVAVNSNILVAQDSTNKAFKVFDKNLNWINTNIFVKTFSGIDFFDSMCLDVQNNLYTSKNTSIYKFLYKTNGVYEFDRVYNIDKYCDTDEKILNLSTAPSNNGILYILTNKNVKKSWTSNLNYIIGEFTINSNLKWFSIAPFNKELDIVCLYGNNNGLENFTVNLDKTSYNSLFNVIDFNVYTLDEVKIKPGEYIQSWTIIKNLEKIYYNCLLVLQNIKYKFVEKEDAPYPLISKKNYNKAFLGFTENLKFEDNFNIGINEIFQADVLNRCLKQILDLQELLLVFVINNASSIKYYSPNPTKGLSSVKQFIYFADDSVLLTSNPIKMNIFEELNIGAGILASLGGAPYTGSESITIEEGVLI